ncbi:MAG: PEP-CTERM sorting domain-containing protein [Gemmatimonadetes bacterium]|nr:PEP-CTERM sorting domain-containing protein [Gemmatimonadota bacterium]
MKLSRKKKIALVAGMLVIAAFVTFIGTRNQAVGATAAIKLDQVVPLVPMPVDSPPAPRPASGWPFKQLPLIAKFDVPVPQIVAIAVTARPVSISDLPARRTPPEPEEEDPGVAPLWLLPLAAGAGFGSASADYHSTVPEPSTLILLSAGLALTGLKARRRKRE